MFDAPPKTPTSPAALQFGVDWVAKHWPRVRLAHEGVMVDRVQRVQRIGEVVARNTMTGKTKDASGWPGDTEGDAMGVSIGDTVHNHYPAPTPAKKPMRTAAKVAAAAALLAAGVGAGTGVPWALGMLNSRPPAVELPVGDLPQVVIE